MRWPGVKSEEYWLGQIWAKLVGGKKSGEDGDGVVAAVVVSEERWTTVISAVRVDDDPTAVNSTQFAVGGWSAVWVLLEIDSTLAPTNIRFLPQFLVGGKWYDFEEGLWASLMWEDTDTANGVFKAFLLPCGGVDVVRIRAIGTGTNAANYFTISTHVRAFRGNFGVAHA